MAVLDDAVAMLASGGLVVFPTESVYGIGADATSPRAVDALVVVRGRETGKPILVVASDLDMVTAVAASVSPLARRLASRFWPGPLTLVLPARADLPAPLTAGSGTIGVRVPVHATARALAARLGRPVTAPSANPPGAVPAHTVAEARAYFGDRIGAYVDGGRCDGAASTVVAIEGERVRIVRAGPVDEAAIRGVVEE
jgi:L-threonylcarbamoyladenylate synthase